VDFDGRDQQVGIVGQKQRVGSLTILIFVFLITGLRASRSSTVYAAACLEGAQPTCEYACGPIRILLAQRDGAIF
jgi:hypothetical protein